jgi:hypothetical protein
MKDSLIIYAADGRTFEMPVSCDHKEREFVAYPPARDEELNITKIHLISEALDCRVGFLLESFTLPEGQAGRWTITLSEDDLGGQKYGLEYYATEQFGAAVVNPSLFHWSHEQEGMTGD